MRRILLVSVSCLAMSVVSSARAGGPTIDDLISLKRAGSPVMSPDGARVAYTVRETNWEENNYVTQIWIADVTTGASYQLTRGAKSSTAPAWSPDSKRLAFGSDRVEKRHIYLIDPSGGEAERLTGNDDSPGSFSWSPDGASIAFTQTDPVSDAMKERDKQGGQFDVIDADYRMSHLYVIDVATKKSRRLTTGAFTIGSFSWSPDGKQIAFDHRTNGATASGGSADISVVDVATSKIRPLVTQAAPDSNPVWSPDGATIAFESKMASADYFFTNTNIAMIPSAGGTITNLSAAFDEDPSIVAWKPSGIWFSASQRTYAHLFRMDPATKAVTRVLPEEKLIGTGFSLSRSADRVAFVSSNATSVPEVFAGSISTQKKLTNMGAQVAAWPKSIHEVVTWKSKDGADVEGILHKPVDFQAGKKYPLLVVIHGGPTGISRTTPFSSTTTYPIDLWLNKGALVLEPNYRGSAGYGAKFRALNVRNLGVGDAWDVLSGIDALIAQGLVDPAQVGTMGWSQGGYISAFLTTHDSARFKAVSVGAGISNWMTYYVSTDIDPFTRQYLKATPWDDPEIYAKTSPMTYIKGAKAPTLIQHGAADQRVPPPNAFELQQGLLDMHVPVKLIMYRGFEGVGHGPSRPKSSRAVMQHNLEWFDQYMFNVK